jgi:hypothetical protein
VQSIGGITLLDSTARTAKNSRITVPNFEKNKKSNGFTEFWKTSSITLSKRQTDRKGLQEKSSFLFWNGDWTTQSIDWVSLIREVRHGNW